MQRHRSLFGLLLTRSREGWWGNLHFRLRSTTSVDIAPSRYSFIACARARMNELKTNPILRLGNPWQPSNYLGEYNTQLSPFVFYLNCHVPDNLSNTSIHSELHAFKWDVKPPKRIIGREDHICTNLAAFLRQGHGWLGSVVSLVRYHIPHKQNTFAKVYDEFVNYTTASPF